MSVQLYNEVLRVIMENGFGSNEAGPIESFLISDWFGILDVKKENGKLVLYLRNDFNVIKNRFFDNTNPFIKFLDKVWYRAKKVESDYKFVSKYRLPLGVDSAEDLGNILRLL